MENWEIAAVFERIAGLLALKGENEFKIRAYTQAARHINRLSEPLAEIATRDSLENVAGVGKALAEKIRELVTTGKSEYLARLEREVPPALLVLFSIPGIGFKTGALLRRELDLHTPEDLEEAARQGRVRRLPGLGKVVEENILRFFAERREAPPAFHRGIAVPLACQLEEYFSHLAPVALCRAAGELRRGVEAVREASFVLALREGAAAEALMEGLCASPAVSAVTGVDAGEGGLIKVTAQTTVGLPLRLFLVQEEDFPAALCYSTGGAVHWRLLAERARRQGMELTPLRLLREGRPIDLESEEDLYAVLDLPHIPPELRESGAEIEMAAGGSLPSLVQPEHIRGDLHLHSDWSDGYATVAELAAAAQKKGYAYLAITDHSPSLHIARGLSVEKLEEQARFIRRLRAEKGVHIFSGVEVDILADGTLDLPDRLLLEMEVVIASVHSHFKQDRETMTTRICKAMAHPAVHMLGHPSGRLLGSRGGYQVNMAEIIRQAARTGTFLEINSSPQRLDLAEEYLPAARRAGVLVSVNTDAHSVVTMEDMSYGVTAARRGWLEPAHLINTRPLEEIQVLLQRKRGGGNKT